MVARQWQIIDNKKVWLRKCPSCNRTVYHINRESWYRSRKKNRICYYCKNKGEGNPFFGKKHTDEWKRDTAKRFTEFRTVISKSEIRVAEILTELDIKFIQQYELDDRFFDFYLPDKNCFIEIDGTYWHAKNVPPEKLTSSQKRTLNND